MKILGKFDNDLLLKKYLRASLIFQPFRTLRTYFASQALNVIPILLIKGKKFFNVGLLAFDKNL